MTRGPLPQLRSATGLHGLERFEALLTEAGPLERREPAAAAELYAEAALAALTGDVEGAAAAAARASRLVPKGDERARATAELATAMVAIVQGRLREGQTILDALPEPEGADVVERVRVLHQAGVGFFYADRYVEARSLAVAAVELARRASARLELATALDTVAVIDARMGKLASAQSKSLEALRLAREQQHTEQVASCLTTLASIEAVQGKERLCRQRTREAAELAPPDHLLHAWVALAHAQLDLGLDRPAAVVADEPRVRALFDALGGYESTEALWLSLVVEAHCRTGDRAGATNSVERLLDIAAHLDTPFARGLGGRCRALVTDDPEALIDFELSLQDHRDAGRPFETARTELCYGERLRRARRPADARRSLESAAATFERLRATPWLQRARRELSAVAGRRAAASTSTLTAHERNVATLVVHGATNKEAAAALFVTAKTVEHHLTRIYAKLGVRSRTELVQALLRDRG